MADKLFLLRDSSVSLWPESGDNSSLLPVNIAGVELRDGSFRWLSENVKQSEVKFCPLRVNRYNYLDCLVHKRRVSDAASCNDSETVAVVMIFSLFIYLLAYLLTY